MRIIFTTVSLVFLSVFIFNIAPAAAQTPWLEAIGIPEGQLIPPDCTEKERAANCDLNDAFQVIVNFSQIILALTGSAALLMFTYGGVMFIIAAGNQDRVNKGKTALQAAVIGLVVVLSAWLIVNFIILALTEGAVGGAGSIFGTGVGENPTDFSSDGGAI